MIVNVESILPAVVQLWQTEGEEQRLLAREVLLEKTAPSNCARCLNCQKQTPDLPVLPCSLYRWEQVDVLLPGESSTMTAIRQRSRETHLLCCPDLHVLTMNAAGNDGEYVLVRKIFALSLHVQLLPKSLIIYFLYDSDDSGIAKQSSGMLRQAGRLASSLHLFSPDKLQACEVSMYVSRLITHIDSAEPAWPESIHPFSFLMQSLYHREKGGEGECCSKSPLPRFCVYYAICFRVLIMVLTDLCVCCWLLVCMRVCDTTWWNQDAIVSHSLTKHRLREHTTFSIRSKPVLNSKSPSWHHWLTWILICCDVISDISSCYLQHEHCATNKIDLSHYQISS